MLEELKKNSSLGINKVFVSDEMMDIIRNELWRTDLNLQQKYLSHKTMPPIYSLYGVEIGLLPDSYTDSYTKTEADT